MIAWSRPGPTLDDTGAFGGEQRADCARQPQAERASDPPSTFLVDQQRYAQLAGKHDGLALAGVERGRQPSNGGTISDLTRSEPARSRREIAGERRSISSRTAGG